jgi:hypothetical protein
MGKRPNPLRRVTGSASSRAVRAHVLARTALLELLARDPAVIAVFADFAPLSDLAEQLGRLGEDLAHRAGLDRAAFLDRPPTALPAAYQALNVTYARAVRDRLPALGTHLKRLVFDTWHLEWWWLVHDLVEHYARLLHSFVTGEGWAGTFTVTLPSPPPPTSGESRDAYLKRLSTFYASPGHEGVRVNETDIRRDVAIFYRRHMQGQSWRSIAKADGLSPWNVKLGDARARTALADVAPRIPPGLIHGLVK